MHTLRVCVRLVHREKLSDEHERLTTRQPQMHVVFALAAGWSREVPSSLNIAKGGGPFFALSPNLTRPTGEHGF